MSGGAFDYDQYKIQYIREEIENVVDRVKNKKPDDWGYILELEENTIKEFETAIDLLKKSHVYVQRIDWLLSGDDGEEAFRRRLKEELANLENKPG